tara:strand:+ start:514 stop:825 length:312 start_codon:yes stop_codon:yes gene_type:complete
MPLSKRAAKICQMHRLGTMSLAELALKMGLSRNQVEYATQRYMTTSERAEIYAKRMGKTGRATMNSGGWKDKDRNISHVDDCINFGRNLCNYGQISTWEEIDD